MAPLGLGLGLALVGVRFAGVPGALEGEGDLGLEGVAVPARVCERVVRRFGGLGVTGIASVSFPLPSVVVVVVVVSKHLEHSTVLLRFQLLHLKTSFFFFLSARNGKFFPSNWYRVRVSDPKSQTTLHPTSQDTAAFVGKSKAAICNGWMDGWMDG